MSGAAVNVDGGTGLLPQYFNCVSWTQFCDDAQKRIGISYALWPGSRSKLPNARAKGCEALDQSAQNGLRRHFSASLAAASAACTDNGTMARGASAAS
jgi:hypothetical protein